MFDFKGFLFNNIFMTEAYDWNPMPHRVNVICPNCSANAIFEFAEIVKISLKKDINYFKKSKLFDYEKFTDSYGHKWHGAIFYHGLNSINNIKDLPKDYSSDDFKHSKYWQRYHGLDIGAKYCNSCGKRNKSDLNWPQDAFYQCQIKGNILWAFNEECLTELRDFIQSNSRNIKEYSYQSFVLHIPSIFLDRKNRKRTVDKLNKLLE